MQIPCLEAYISLDCHAVSWSAKHRRSVHSLMSRSVHDVVRHHGAPKQKQGDSRQNRILPIFVRGKRVGVRYVVVKCTMHLTINRHLLHLVKNQTRKRNLGRRAAASTLLDMALNAMQSYILEIRRISTYRLALTQRPNFSRPA